MAQSHDIANQEVLREIFRQTEADIKVGRISQWEPLNMRPTAPPTRRFGVQQSSSNGKHKVRCIDDYKESRVNMLCEVTGKIRMGNISDLVGTARQLQEAEPDARLVIFKADFKSAYRCVPIRPEDYAFAKILVTNPADGSVNQAQQFAIPFGSIATVYGWDRLAHAITFLIRHVLLLPACRYVDDIFGVCFDYESDFVRNSLSELVTMLGFKLEAAKTPVPASMQLVLGIQLEVKYVNRRGRSSVKVYASIEPVKAMHWAAVMEDVLRAGYIGAKDAERLAGRLNFAAGAIAGRSGAARIRYIYCLATKGGGKLVAQAREEMQWWMRCLCMGQKHRFPLSSLSLPIILLYTDAEGGGGIGGCLCIESVARKQRLFFADRLDQRFMNTLQSRVTQIIPLEAMAVAVAVEVFKVQLSGARCIFLIGNLSVLGALREGRCTAPDINRIVCSIVDRILSLSIMPFFLWVPSCFNMADAPSRGAPVVGFQQVGSNKGIVAAMARIK